MGSKVYKGMEVGLEGSPCGEFPFITKYAYTSTCCSLEYTGDCKVGGLDHARHHYIEKYEYDACFNLIDVKIAQNKLIANATAVTLSVQPYYVHVILTPGNGDFTEMHTGDTIYVKTPTQLINNVPVEKISDYEVKIKIDVSCNGIVDKSAAIAITDIVSTLNHEETKDYNKRRWDYRDRYQFS
jgi:hypothetical protein